MTDRYENPLITRYASQEMSHAFSAHKKFTTWRKLWVALAESQNGLGLEVSHEQVEELRSQQENLNLDVAQEKEKEIKHDVLSHIYAYGEQCPTAKPIIHLGATSCFVTDNADQCMQRDALTIVQRRLMNSIEALSQFALDQKSTPCLGYTHLQPAQPTTIGKRASLWLQDFVLDMKEVSRVKEEMPFRSVKGTTGTHASFVALFEGDAEKVLALEKNVATKMDFSKVLPVSGQTYTRKLDTQLLNVLAGIAESAHKYATDIRLLASRREVEEPFGTHQKGSSAMAYKRNPMRCERVCALARYVMALPQTMAHTHATQWMERTLDDSALRRIVIPQAFLAIDAILRLVANVAQGLQVNELIVKKHLNEEVPFMATENIIMHCVKKGADRQKLHTLIRDHSMAALTQMKAGGENDLLSRILADPNIPLTAEELRELLNVRHFIGRAPEQVDEFVQTEVIPLKEQYGSATEEVDIQV